MYHGTQYDSSLLLGVLCGKRQIDVVSYLSTCGTLFIFCLFDQTHLNTKCTLIITNPGHNILCTMFIVLENSASHNTCTFIRKSDLPRSVTHLNTHSLFLHVCNFMQGHLCLVLGVGCKVFYTQLLSIPSVQRSICNNQVHHHLLQSKSNHNQNCSTFAGNQLTRSADIPEKLLL